VLPSVRMMIASLAHAYAYTLRAPSQCAGNCMMGRYVQCRVQPLRTYFFLSRVAEVWWVLAMLARSRVFKCLQLSFVVIVNMLGCHAEPTCGRASVRVGR